MIHLAVNFHYVGMPGFPHAGIHGLTVDAFRAHIETLVRQYEPVSLADVLDAVRGARPLPSRSCLITFDDGLRCQAEHALPVLDTLGVPAAFFVMAGPYLHGRPALVHQVHWCRAQFGDARLIASLDRARCEGLVASGPDDVDQTAAARLNPYDEAPAARVKYFLSRTVDVATARRLLDRFLDEMGAPVADLVDWLYLPADAVGDLARRGWVGSHAVSHAPLPALPAAAAFAELCDSRAWLERLSGGAIRALSYPYGIADSVTRAEARLAEKAGYLAAYTMERACNTSLDDPLLLARIDCRDLGRIDGLGDRARYRVSGASAPPAGAP